MAAFVSDAPRRARASLRTLLAAAVAVVLVLGAARLVGLVPSLLDPFATRTVDRSEPAVLHALADVSEYRAASANYSVILDVEKDARWLPAFVKGERTVFVAAGAVDAGVDLGGLDADRVVVDGERVVLHLPEPVLAPAVIDPARSRVASRERGVLDRVGAMFSDNPTSERGLYLRAQQRLDTAARADTALVDRAERNTRRMLERLLRPLGFERVTVRFGTA